MMTAQCLTILLIAYALPSRLAFSQYQPKREYVFRGDVSEAECREFPALQFDIPPSMDRANSKDHLTVRCVPGEEDKSSSLSLIFIIIGDTNRNNSSTRQFSFRWGQDVGENRDSTVGQFTKDAQKCTAFVALFQSKISKTAAYSLDNLQQSPQWTAGCNPDDRWGTSMEIVLTGKIGESL